MKVKIHYSIILVFLVFIYTGFYLEFIILISTIIAHEFGHFLMAKLFKVQTRGLKLTIVGGVLELNIKKLAILKELSIYLAGITVNLLLLFLSRFIPNVYYQNLIYQYNLLLIKLNLLPIYPLDGFKTIDVLIRLVNKPFLEYKIVCSISILSLIFLTVYSFLSSFTLNILVIIIYLVYQNVEYIMNKQMIVLKRIVYHYQA